MRLSKMTLAAIAALGMASTPVLAQTSSPASKLSISGAASKQVRSGATLKNANNSRGGSWLLAGGVLVLVVLGAVLLSGGNDDPASS